MEAIFPFSAILAESLFKRAEFHYRCRAMLYAVGDTTSRHTIGAQITRTREHWNKTVFPMIPVFKLPRSHFKQLHAPLSLGQIMLIFTG